MRHKIIERLGRPNDSWYNLLKYKDIEPRVDRGAVTVDAVDGDSQIVRARIAP